MNKRRRAEIAAIIAVLSVAEYSADDVSGALDDVRSVRNEEQECLDNMPENLEGSEQYEKMEHAIDCLDDAADNLEDAVEYLEEDCDTERAADCVGDAISSLESAME